MTSRHEPGGPLPWRLPRRAVAGVGPMSSGLIIVLELALVLGVVIGLAVWELWRLRRGRRRPPA
jgi:hypothetical protein